LNGICLNKNMSIVLIAVVVLLSFAGMGKAASEVRDSDIMKQMPEIMTDSSPSVLPEDQQEGRLRTGAGTIELSIEQAVMEVIQNNRDLTAQRLETVKDGTFEMIERASFDPEVFAEISVAREKILDPSETEDERITIEKIGKASLGLQKKFAAGTSVRTEISHERDASDDIPEDRKTRIGISLTQSLLNGFGPSVNLASVRQAELDTAISLEELKGFTEMLIADTEIAYWQCVLAKREIAIFEQSLAIAKKQRDEIEQQIDVGILPRTEAAAARAEVALREQDLIDARSLAEGYRLKLLHLIRPGYDASLDTIINLTSKPDIETLPVADLTDRLKLAEKARSDLNEARFRLRKNRLETVITRNGLLPRLDFFIRLGRTGYADTFSGTFQGFSKDEANDFQLGLTLSHAIGNRKAEAIDQAAIATRIQAEMAVDNYLKLIQLDVRLSVNEVERTRKQIKATGTTRMFQEQTVTAEEDRFDVGSSTALLVAQAQRDLLSARIAEVEAVVGFRIALIRLYLAEGSLLEMRGIRIESPNTAF